jgi:hypothetical protein
MFSRFQIAGEALAIAALSASAVAQNAQAPINTPTELEAALQACWVPPPMEQSRPGMQITVLMSFKRNGELFEQPRIVFQSREASERNARHTATPWRKRSNDVPLCRSRRRSETP